MTAPVPQAAVDAAMKALDCEELRDRSGAHYCVTHHAGWLNDIDSCVRAEAVAAAVVAAVQGPIKTEALREAVIAMGDDWRLCEYDRAAYDWLSAYADRIEAQP